MKNLSMSVISRYYWNISIELTPFYTTYHYLYDIPILNTFHKQSSISIYYSVPHDLWMCTCMNILNKEYGTPCMLSFQSHFNTLKHRRQARQASDPPLLWISRQTDKAKSILCPGSLVLWSRHSKWKGIVLTSKFLPSLKATIFIHTLSSLSKLW